jgi:adenosylhomocysteine nucleosidase
MVRVSGIGLERAARAAQQLLEAGADSLLCFGVGGALNPALNCGDIVIASEVLCAGKSDADPSSTELAPARLATGAEWRQGLSARLIGLGGLHVGAVLSSDELVASAERKQQLYRQSGALAVDMESAAVARIARHEHIPFMALRVIADTAQDSLPGVLHSALGSGGAVARGASFWWSLLSAPGSWLGLARLGSRYRRACAVLARCGRAGVAAPVRSSTAAST